MEGDGSASGGGGGEASTSGGGEDASTPRKSLFRSASWAPRSSPVAEAKPDESRPTRRPARLALPARPPASGWPKPALDDSVQVFCSDLSRVAGHVYLGSDAAARDRAALRRHGITHVLNCVGSACPNYFLADQALRYATLWLHDSPAEDLASVLYDAFDFLEAAAATGGRALVHCVRGASRSAAVVVAYLMWRQHLPFDAALQRVRAARPAADPNLGFAAQLLRRQPRVGLASPGPPGRVLRLAPHSPYAPLHLVPKAIPAPSQSSGVDFLDSRGAFLVHVPDTVYVWLGTACDAAMASATGRIARQLVKYERAIGPIVTVHEGTEPNSFWSAVMGKDGTAPDASVVGERRVELYDLDFEIFQHALNSIAEDSPESATPSSSSSTASTFSPLSSLSPSSDYYNSPSTPGRLEVCQTPRTRFDLGMPPFQTSRGRGTKLSSPVSSGATASGRASVRSLAERRGSIAPPLVLSLQGNEETVWLRDWCLSPAFIPDVEEVAVNVDQRLTLGPSEELETEEDGIESSSDHGRLIHPSLFCWPEMDEVEIQPGVLESRSVFLMLAPKPRLGAMKSKARILYVWLGCESELNEGVEERDRDIRAKKIGVDFLGQMELPTDIPIEEFSLGNHLSDLGASCCPQDVVTARAQLPQMPDLWPYMWS